MMDSGSSGSIQSSSGGACGGRGGAGGAGGGDEEYESHGDHHHHQSNNIAPSFFNHPFSNHFGSLISNPPLLSHQPPTLFDLQQTSQNLDTFPNIHYKNHNNNINNNNNNNNDNNKIIWPSGLRSSPQTTYANLSSSLSSSSSSSSSSYMQSLQSSSSTQQQQANVAKTNTKKRTRASRRAPTTVLTTDTTNFRQMVQEFTGIPTPPFPSGGSAFSRPRLDLFSPVSSSSLASLYPLRPSPQKPYQLSPFMPSSSSSSPLLNPSVMNNNFAQTPSNILGLLQKQPQNLLTMHNNNNNNNNNNQLLTFNHNHQPFLSTTRLSQGGFLNQENCEEEARQDQRVIINDIDDVNNGGGQDQRLASFDDHGSL